MGCGSSSEKNRKNNKQSIKLGQRHQSKGADSKLEAKIVLIGNSGVGKTSIVTRYNEGTFKENTEATVGASYFKKNIAFKDGSQLRLHIWDTSGSEKFKSISPLYYRNAHAALVVYSVIDEDSLNSIDEWIKQLEDYQTYKTLIKIVIGNKSDVSKDERRIQFKQGKEFAQQRGLDFFETSSVLNDGSINDVFQRLAASIKQNFTEEELSQAV